MQEIITWILVLVAFSIMGYKAIQSLKSFKKVTSSCNGCGGGCCGCPVAPGNRKVAKR